MSESGTVCQRSEQCRHRWPSLVVTTLLATLAFGGCNPEDRIRVGMKEPEVTRILGEPTEVIKDSTRFLNELAYDRACANLSSRVLVFTRRHSTDVRLGIDEGGTVRCIHKTQDILR